VVIRSNLYSTRPNIKR